jgi:hypothetical protein
MPFRLEISEIERVFEAGLDAGNAAGDLAGDEGLAADRVSKLTPTWLWAARL